MIRAMDGPECPRCGSRASDCVGRKESWYGWRNFYECWDCGQLYFCKKKPDENTEEQQHLVNINPADCVVYYPHSTQCPHCNSNRTRVYNSSKKPIRYHRCQDCHQTFKSMPPDG